MNFIDSLNIIHNKIKDVFSAQADEDKNFANELENFLNWILGDDSVVGAIKDPFFKNLMDSTNLRDELRKEFQLYFQICLMQMENIT